MSDFKAKMHQIRFRLGILPRPACGTYSAPPNLLAGFKGAASRQGGGTGRDGKRERRGWGGRDEEGGGKGEKWKGWRRKGGR